MRQIVKTCLHLANTRSMACPKDHTKLKQSKVSPLQLMKVIQFLIKLKLEILLALILQNLVKGKEDMKVVNPKTLA